MSFKTLYLLPLLVFGIVGCQGQRKTEPPVHLNLNMDFQTAFQSQRENDFFADKRAMRPLEEGVVPRGALNDDQAFYMGKKGNDYITTLPIPLTHELVERGQKRFDIYCVPCHSATGLGNGIVVQRGMIPPPNFIDDRIVTMPAGQIFETITHGVRNMPPYGYAIPTHDRWAIVSYVRALQIAQRAKLQDIPADVANAKGWTK